MPMPPSRCALLVLSMLTACAASDIASDGSDRVSNFQPTGAFSDYLVGRFAVQRTDLETAADRLGAALAADPANPELANQAFLAATLAGKPDAVRLAASLPNNPVAQMVIGDADVKAGRWDRAEAHFTGLPQQGLTEVLRPLLIAWAQEGAGRTDAALGTLAPFVEGQRFRGVYALHAALIADHGGQTAEAARLYRQAATEYGPANLRLAVMLASWQARQGSLAEAQHTIRDLATANGDLAIALPALEASAGAPVIRSPADGIAEVYLALAATLRQQNNDAAHVLLHLALDLRPDFTSADLILADIDEAAKRPSAALSTLAAIPDSDPLIAVVQLRRASLLDQAGRTDQAASVLSELARAHPDRPEPLAQQGDILRRKNRFPEAVQAYDAAIARIGTPNRTNWPLFYERGIAEERAGDWAKAEADFQYALQLAPDQPNILNYLAYAWTERGENLERARSMVERAVQQRPNDGAIVDSLGWIMLRQGDTTNALKQLERAVELQPEDSVINAHLGDALAAAGRTREAEFQWRRALILNPEPDDARQIEQKLAALPRAGATKTAAPAAGLH